MSTASKAQARQVAQAATARGANPAHKAATKAGKVVTTKAATKGHKATKGAGQPPTTAALKAMPTTALLALRAATPRAELKLHYAIRRALRAGGYFISQNR